MRGGPSSNYFPYRKIIAKKHLYSDGSSRRLTERNYFSKMKKVMSKIHSLADASGLEPPSSDISLFSLEYTKYLEDRFEAAYTSRLAPQVDPNKPIFGVGSLYKFIS